MIPEQVERFFRTAQIRYNIHLKRERGEPPPWTEVPLFNQYRFCNVFREDDKVTRWIAREIRDPFAWNPCIVYAMVLARFFNLPSTLEILKFEHMFDQWDPDKMRRVLSFKKPLITGAYMVKTPLRKPKLEGLIEIFAPVWRDRRMLYNFCQTVNSMERTCARLEDYPWIGPFMAYQITRDLVYTSALDQPVDYRRWAEAGPGALKGLRYLCSGHGTGKVEGRPLDLMRELTEKAQSDEFWPKAFPEWTIQETETWLCEFGKYEKARLGEGRPKQLYRP